MKNLDAEKKSFDVYEIYAKHFLLCHSYCYLTFYMIYRTTSIKQIGIQVWYCIFYTKKINQFEYETKKLDFYINLTIENMILHI